MDRIDLRLEVDCKTNRSPLIYDIESIYSIDSFNVIAKRKREKNTLIPIFAYSYTPRSFFSFFFMDILRMNHGEFRVIINNDDRKMNKSEVMVNNR